MVRVKEMKNPYGWHSEAETPVPEYWEPLIAFVVCILIMTGVPAP